jgi:hypothetical protein
MSRKSRHGRSRKAQKKHRRSRRRGGADALQGAPVNYALAGSWPSKMSLGQGTDFFQYHKGQHGGAEIIQPAPLSAIEDCMLPNHLRASAHVGGLDAAIKYASQFKDQAGGRRTRRRIHRGSRHHRHSRRCHHGGKRKQRKQSKQRKQRKSRGGAELEYAPFPSKGMLLNDQMYAQAGLNPSWKNDIAYVDAKIRDSQ